MKHWVLNNLDIIEKISKNNFHTYFCVYCFKICDSLNDDPVCSHCSTFYCNQCAKKLELKINSDNEVIFNCVTCNNDLNY